MTRMFRALAFTSCMMAWAAVDAAATEYRCQKGESSLRVAIEVKKVGHTLPCEVVAEDDRGERALLYSAQYDRDYCPSRIEKTRDELEQEGWSCQKTSDDNVVSDVDASVDVAERQPPVQAEEDVEDAGTAAAASGRTIAVSHLCRQDDAQRRIQIEVENSSSGKPCELIFWSEDKRDGPGQLLWRAEHDATFCPRRLDIIIDKWSGEGWSCESGDVQTATAAERIVDGDATTEPATDQLLDAARVPVGSEEEVAAPDADDPALTAVIAADAERIGEWMEVEPAIEVAARGDLNDDGSDDAVVFLAYQSDQAAYRQYLMSYVVADDGYELASVKLLTGVGPPPDQARVEEIDEGVIWLTLPDDGAGVSSEPTGYRLRDQELVEVAPENGSAGGN